MHGFSDFVVLASFLFSIFLIKFEKKTIYTDLKKTNFLLG